MGKKVKKNVTINNTQEEKIMPEMSKRMLTRENKLLEELTDEQKRYLKLFIDADFNEGVKEVYCYAKALTFLLGKAVIKFDDVSDSDEDEETEEEKAERILNNIKLGNMGSYALLFGCNEWYIPEFDVWERGTCGKYCIGCFDMDHPTRSACYCAKSYVRHTFKNPDGSTGNPITGKCWVKLGHWYRTVAMRYFKKYLLERLTTQIKNKLKADEKEGKDIVRTIRINESGEIESTEDLKFWCELASRFPQVKFYIYTKNFEAVRDCIEDDVIPENMFINISIWHELGIKEYHEFSSHPQIRAFVYVDNDWTVGQYAKHNLFIDAMCPAYDSKGVMNHAITCDTCGNRHCHSHFNKVTGCFSH